MARLPVVSGRELVRAFEELGYVLDRQKGSHMGCGPSSAKPGLVRTI